MKIEIIPFRPEYKNSVIEISDEQFGKNFIDGAKLDLFLNNKEASGYVAMVDGKAVGFSFFHWCRAQELSKFIFTDKDWVLNVFKNSGLVGYRRFLAVKKEFQGKGIGGNLVDLSIRKLEEKTNTMVVVIWKKKLSSVHENLLKKRSFKSVRIIPDYWKEDSLKRNYECAVCGLPPCRCTGEVFVRHEK